MVPPPSAVMHPSMHTPAQSMLRPPAASAAVIACAASAISDSQYSAKSPVGRLSIETQSLVLYASYRWNLGRRFHHEQCAMNAARFPEHRWPLEVVFGQLEEPIMAYQPTDPYRAPLTED